MATDVEASRVRKFTGAHYTPPDLAEFLARRVADAWQGVDQPIVLDPGVGDGELLAAMINVLANSSRAPASVYGFDTDTTAVEFARRRINALDSGALVSLETTNFLDVITEYIGQGEEGFFASKKTPTFDIVIANPPYVRTQVMGAREAQRLAAVFGLSGRVDLYFAFLSGIASVLRPGGIAGIIVSNRFMTTKAGAAVRRALRTHFEILGVWDLGDTRLFDAAVLPVVMVLRRSEEGAVCAAPPFTSIYTAEDDGSAVACEGVFAALSVSGLVRTRDGGVYRVRQGTLDTRSPVDSVWRLSSEQSNDWLKTVASHAHCSFGDIGKVRVGVKTTADKVFIRSDWSQLAEADRPELLRPLITHHIARRYRAERPIYELIYPHEVVAGRRVAVNLDQYPRTGRYLAQHRAVLESRQYVAQAGRQWYEIWVPHDPELWALPKLVFRDITDKPVFWMDLDGSVVNGDCYWMVVRAGVAADMLWLALAVANSTFAEAFYDYSFHNKLYAGRRRFMTQYVEKFPLPSPHTPIAKRIVATAKECWQDGSDPVREGLLDRLVWSAFGLAVEEVRGQRDL